MTPHRLLLLNGLSTAACGIGMLLTRGVLFREFGLQTPGLLDAVAVGLLAYALTDEQANQTQRALIAQALAYRPLADGYRGVAPTLSGLNGRWAVPGMFYGQSIAALARRMRGG